MEKDDSQPKTQPSGSRPPPRPPHRTAVGLGPDDDDPEGKKPQPKKETVRINLPPSPQPHPPSSFRRFLPEDMRVRPAQSRWLCRLSGRPRSSGRGGSFGRNEFTGLTRTGNHLTGLGLKGRPRNRKPLAV